MEHQQNKNYDDTEEIGGQDSASRVLRHNLIKSEQMKERKKERKKVSLSMIND